jgi:hypothetical protein
VPAFIAAPKQQNEETIKMAEFLSNLTIEHAILFGVFFIIGVVITKP